MHAMTPTLTTGTPLADKYSTTSVARMFCPLMQGLSLPTNSLMTRPHDPDHDLTMTGTSIPRADDHTFPCVPWCDFVASCSERTAVDFDENDPIKYTDLYFGLKDKLEKITSSLTFSDEKARRELGWNPASVIEYYSKRSSEMVN